MSNEVVARRPLERKTEAVDELAHFLERIPDLRQAGVVLEDLLDCLPVSYSVFLRLALIVVEHGRYLRPPEQEEFPAPTSLGSKLAESMPSLKKRALKSITVPPGVLFSSSIMRNFSNATKP